MKAKSYKMFFSSGIRRKTAAADNQQDHYPAEMVDKVKAHLQG